MKQSSAKKLFLIDGSSFLYRAYYGTRPLHTSKGEPVHAVYSFCRMIKKLIDRFGVQHISLVWDSKGPTVRHEMFTEYKATRQAPPSDLFEQKERIIQFADAIGLHQIAQPGYEADDLMYSIAQDYAGDGTQVILVTADKDMGQAITGSIVLYDFFKDQLLDKARFEEKMGFAVEKLPFYFSLLGDASDNIPGVKGIGKKGAQELVLQFDSLEHMYENLDQIAKPRMKNALIENKENAFLSRDLFLLQYTKTDVSRDDLSFNSADWVRAFSLFKELEFKSLITDGANKEQRQIVSEQKIIEIKKKDFIKVVSPDQLKEIVDQIRTAKFVAIDTETTGVNPYVDRMVGISLSVNEQTAYYIPCAHETGEEQLSLQTIQEILTPVFADTTIRKIFHHAKFDLHVLAEHGLPVAGPIFDTMIAASLVAKEWQRIGLKSLAEYYFDEQMLTFDEMVKEHKLKTFAQVPLDQATLYAANDAHQTFKLAKLFAKEMSSDGTRELFKSLEMPLMQILFDMERFGIRVDKATLQDLDSRLSRALSIIEQDIKGLLPDQSIDINLNSPKQVEQLLFHELKLPPQKKSGKKTGYSTDSEVLQILSELHPVPSLILKYRELYKLQSTYAQGLQAFINAKDERIHTSFSQTRVATGRLSSLNPNMQNIPASGPGLAVRAAFKPDEGNLFISADYSQIELRVLAYLSGDKALTQAFLDGRDIHKETAARLFEVPFDHVSATQRQVGKRINFSILYGLTPYGLSKDLNIPFTDAKEYIDKYFAQYPGVKAWMDSVVEQAQEHGYVTTHMARKRYIPAIHEKNRVLFDEAKRVAINTVAQGTAAEIVKQGMINLAKQFNDNKMPGQMLLQIHDELLIQAPKDQEQQVVEVVKNILENVVNWPVPLEVTIRTGADWKEVSK